MVLGVFFLVVFALLADENNVYISVYIQNSLN